MRFLLVLALSTGCGAPAGGPLRIDTANAQRTTATRSDSITAGRRTAIVEAAERVGRSVVSISVVSRRQVTTSGDPFDFFSFFVPRTTERLVRGYGTGFVIRPGGIIVTNQHVVEDADSITVSLPDGTDLPARLLGDDPTTDIAVLKVGQELPPAAIGRSADLLIGEWVIALGNPYVYLLGDAEPTVTAGVVSATGRNVVPSGNQTGLYLDMIQTDAAINQGNSGGPLANSLGEVVGVNSFIFTNSGGSVGIGFAIPIERANRIADEIVRNGSVRRAWTGLSVGDATTMRDWKSAGGVQVAEVVAGGPAATSGIAPGAILVEANGRRLRNYLDWEAVKLDLHVGDPVTLRFKSSPSSPIETRRIVTGDLPSVTAARVSLIRGLDLITVTASVRAERQLQREAGALIYRIADDVSRATGLREGDVIWAINRTVVRTADQAAQLLESIGSNRQFQIYFERGGVNSSVLLSFR
ncbi:MAG: trypsin-like peptidase domain-containing protein [Gemmatimonadales bacterium]